MKIIEKAYNDHASNLVKWALRKFKSPEDAEDLCQEVMSRFTKMVITKEAEGEEIAKIDSYIWIIAHNIVNDYFADTSRKDKLVKDLENDVGTPFMVSETASIADAINGVPTNPEGTDDTDILLQKLRLSISQLDYNLREAMIMYHLEKKSLAEISKKLKVSESYVKKLLFESRQKIRQNDRKGLYEVGKAYRPNRVTFAISGPSQTAYKCHNIKGSLSKQNICLACYEKPRTVEEIAMQLGMPSAYIEFDLEWLVENNFIIKKRDRYATAFVVHDGTFHARLRNMYIQHKATCTDKIVDVLTAKADRIKAIGFYGSHKPINMLLWLLIHNFTNIVANQIYLNEHGCAFDCNDKRTGEPYYLKGYFDTESKIPLDPLFMDKYMELTTWGNNGPYLASNDDNRAKWYWLARGKEYLPHNSIFTTPVVEPQNYFDNQFLWKACRPGFVIDDLSEEERYTLSQCIDNGFLSLSEDGKTVIPHFYVFTHAQREELDKIFIECAGEVIAEMTEFYHEMRKMCKEVLPKQVDDYLDWISLQCIGESAFFTTGFAFYDGKLFVPKDKDDFTLMTLSVTV